MLLGAAVTVALLALACGGGDGDAAPADGHYENKSVRYVFDYPADWGDVSDAVRLGFDAEQPDIVDTVAVGSVEPELGLLNGVHVTVIRVKAEVTSDSLPAELDSLNSLYEQLAAQAAGRLAEVKDVELGGLRARQYVVEFVYAGRVQAASAQTVTFFGDRQYTVNCQGLAETFDTEVLPGCEQVLQTFHFR